MIATCICNNTPHQPFVDCIIIGEGLKLAKTIVVFIFLSLPSSCTGAEYFSVNEHKRAASHTTTEIINMYKVLSTQC